MESHYGSLKLTAYFNGMYIVYFLDEDGLLLKKIKGKIEGGFISDSERECEKIARETDEQNGLG